MKIKKSLRTAALLICLCSAAVSCTPLIVIHNGDETTDAVTENETPAVTRQTEPVTEVPDIPVPHRPDWSAEAKERLDALRDADYSQTGNILIASVGTTALFGEDTEGSALRDSTLAEMRVSCMKTVEEKYSVHFLTFTYSAEELFQKVKEESLAAASSYIADYYFLSPTELGKYQANGLLYNLRSLPFTDFSAPYFDADAMKAASAGHGICAAIGDFTFSPENTWCVYVNRDLSEKLGLPSPYASVYDGTWTWERFFENSRAAAALDGISGDNFGGLAQEEAEAVFLASSGLHTIKSGIDVTPSIVADADAMQTLADILFANVMNGTTSKEDADLTLFSSGSSLYYAGPVGYCRDLADIPTRWGVLPLPKYAETQESYSSCSGGNGVLCVPSDSAQPDMTGTLLQALFAASCSSYGDLYIDTALAYYLRDGASANMLDIVFSSVTYDFASMFASGYPALSNATVGAFHRALTSKGDFPYYADYYTQAALDELNGAFPVRQY